MIATQPDAGGHFGPYGGRYVPEVLMAPLEELEQALRRSEATRRFKPNWTTCCTTTPDGPRRSTTPSGLASIWAARRSTSSARTCCTPARTRSTTASGQALLARRMGKKRIIAETGAGQHGVATATVCALFGLECVVYMGEEDMRRQRLNVFRMRLLGAKVVRRRPRGSRTLKDAISEAMRDWVTNVDDHALLAGLGAGRASLSDDGARFSSRASAIEARAQILEREGRLPDTVFACVGGGSMPSASSTRSLPDDGVELVGVEAGGRGTRLGRTCGAVRRRLARRAAGDAQLSAAG